MSGITKAMATRTSRGRQKIDMAKMRDDQSLLVTFSKRRAGLFKKASEVCILTGSEVALVIFSPGGRAYSFGCPSVDSIIERFESQNNISESRDPSNLLADAGHTTANSVQCLRLTMLENQYHAERQRGESLNTLKKDGQNKNWWEAPADELNMEQLEQLNLAFAELRKDVKAELKKVANGTDAGKDKIFQGIQAYEQHLYDMDNIKKKVPSVYDLFQPESSGNMEFSPYAAAGPSGVNAGVSIEHGTSIPDGENVDGGPGSVFDVPPNPQQWI